MSWIQRVLYGVDLDEEQHRQDQLRAALAAENEKDREKYGDAWFEEAQRNNDSGYVSDVDGAVDQAFDEGLEEGADNVTAFVSKPFEIAGKGVGAVLAGFPWWLWIAGLAVLGFFLWPVVAPALAARSR
jgi:hypothetical protein